MRPADFAVSTTDPDATHLPFRDGVRLGYQGHYLVDGGKARIILGALATPGEVPEERPALDLIWRARARWRLRLRQATGDKAYGTHGDRPRPGGAGGARLRAGARPRPRHALFSKDAFRYDPVADTYTCPAGATLSYGARTGRGACSIIRRRRDLCGLPAQGALHHGHHGPDGQPPRR